MTKLNLGSGLFKKEGYINIDLDKSVNPDLVCSVENLPFQDNSIDEVYAKNIFEHIPNPLNFLLEIKRVLKKGSRVIIITDNSSYFIYHFPREKGHHDYYNTHHYAKQSEDNHYFLFQKGHLIAFTEKAGMKLIKLDYHIEDTRLNRNRIFQLLISKLIGKKFGYGCFYWEMEK